MERIVRNAYAKINLGLDVLRRREDGYHEVKMIMQTIGLYDTLTFTRKEEPGIELKIDRAGLDTGKGNLICLRKPGFLRVWKFFWKKGFPSRPEWRGEALMRQQRFWD